MFARLSRGQRRTALVIASLVSLVAMGACSSSPTGPDRVAPTDGGRAAPTDGMQVRQAKVLFIKPVLD